MEDRQPQTRGGLGTLPRNVGLSQEDVKKASTAWKTFEKVEAHLKERGFIPPDQPSFPRPTITPEQLTTVINKDYTMLYSHHLAWFNYTSPILAQVKSMLIQTRNEMKDIETKIRKDLRLKNKTLPKDERFNEKEIADEVWSDPAYKILTREEQKYEQTKLQLESYLEVTEGTLKVISRQVEIRKLELDGSRAEGSMPGRGRFNNPRVP